MAAWLWAHGCRTVVTSRCMLHAWLHDCIETWMHDCKAASMQGCLWRLHECNLHEGNAAGMKGSMNARLQEYKAAWMQGCKNTGQHKCKAARIQDSMNARLQEYKAAWMQAARIQGSMNARLQEYKAALMQAARIQGSMNARLLGCHAAWIQGCIGAFGCIAVHSFTAVLVATPHTWIWAYYLYLV